ncbi:hypothetical protein [Rehaibacterium terrae]|jgi:hypothetical protein|uniref:Lipoprotein n=1 Tax=Rehaibacterium terrae TaxID=1341696 RepID=A0A7W7Y030_9GAMM|nr:hypothetical protein [Rehaibacterium terrae]MBB5015654.1 hypothetical protein [Rehaibacterium terrae]
MRNLLMVAALASLAACAGRGELRATEQQTASLRQDAEYIAAVERIARRRGVQVYWVNPPQRRSDEDRPY